MYNKLKIKILIILVLYLFNSHAQSFTISGKILNQEKKPIANATIIVKEKKDLVTLGFGFSNTEGSYSIKFNSVNKDSILLYVSLLGYQKKEVMFFTKPLLIQDILLEYDFQALPQVLIRNSKIYNRGDTINYNVKSFTEKQDLVIGDIIKRLPGIEVGENGVIKYQGKTINKYYIEGLDLLDDKYGLANNNIPANAVNQVQILENHQPIKALDSFSSSNRAAINLKLNTNSKNKLIGTTKAGIGITPLLLDEQLVPMRFNKKNQTMASYKYNNSGYDYLTELEQLNQAEFTNGLKANMFNVNLVSIPTPSLPNISKNRFLFNNSHTLSVNHLTKLSNDYELKINLDYINNLETQASGSTIKNYFLQDSIIIREKQSLSRSQEILKVGAALISNNKNRYIRNVSSVNIVRNHDFGNILASDTTNQIANYAVSSFFNDFQIIKVKKKLLTELGSFFSHSTLPQNLIIKPSKYPFLPSNNNSYSQLEQSLSLATLFANNYFNVNMRYANISIENKIGFSFLSQKFNSNLYKYENNQKTSVNDSFVNCLQGSEIVFYDNVNLRYLYKNISVSLNIPISLTNLYAENSYYKSEIKKNIIFNYGLNFGYNFKNGWKAIFSNTYIKNYNQPYTASNNYILTNYRTLSNQNSILKYFIVKEIDLSINYKNIVKSFFTNSGFVATQSEYNNINNQQYSNFFLFTNSIEQPNTSSNYRIYSSISKYIYKFRTSYKITIFGNKNISNQSRLFSRSTFINNSIGISAKINIQIKNTNIEYNNQYQQYFLAIQNNSVISKTVFLNQKIVLSTVLASDFIFSVIMEQSNFKMIGNSNRNYYFSDIRIRKKLIKSKAEIEANCQNIFGISNFETLSINNNVQTNSYYVIRPRQFLVKFLFNL